MIKRFDKILWTPQQEQPDVRPRYHSEVFPFYQLYEDVSYSWLGTVDKVISFYRVEMPSGLYVDGQSAPRFAWSFGFLPDGLCRMAALNHDGLYQAKGGAVCPLTKGLNAGLEIRVYQDGKRVILGRHACDQLYKACYLATAPKEARKARIGFNILVVTGWLYWGKKKF